MKRSDIRSGVMVIGMFLFFCINTIAQNRKTPEQAFAPYIRPESSEHILLFKEETTLKRQDVIKKIVSDHGAILPAHVNMKVKKEERDELGKNHATYELSVAGVPVENQIIRIHEQNNDVQSATFPESMNIPEVGTQPSVEADAAEAIATSQITKFSVPQKEKQSLARPELLISDIYGSYKLVWKVEVFRKNIFDRYFVYVDAINGNIVKKVSRSHNCGGSFSAPTLYNGNQTIYYDLPGPLSTNNILKDDCRPKACAGSSLTAIITRGYDPIEEAYYEFTNPSNVLTWPTNYLYRTGYSAHWALEKSFDYYKCMHNRDSYNNAYATIIATYGAIVDNSCWTGAEIVLGSNSSRFSGPLVTLDIVAHEFTHAVTDHTGDLIYEKESGALNEAWSDIMATATEYYVNGPTTGTWKVGEDIFPNGFRSLSNPNDNNHPDTYKGRYWVDASAACVPDTTNDACGVHENSGVGNRWFYLLSEGSGNYVKYNDLGDPYLISGIGTHAAAAIAYRALTTYFTPTTNFHQARVHTIRAAEDLFGVCSNAAVQVSAAWYAVGVFVTPDNVTVCSNYSPGSYFRKSMNILRAGSNFCSNGAGTTIGNGASVTFTAGGAIDLGPNFEAAYGSHLLASINLCVPGESASTFRTDYTSVDESEPENRNMDLNAYNDFISIFPNPSDGHVTLVPSTEGKISVLNSIGEEVFTTSAQSLENINMDLSSYSKGVYFVKLTNGSESKTQKFILE